MSLRSMWAAALAAGMILAAPAAASAQGVAIIDLSWIFQNHPGFKKASEKLKAEVEATEKTLRDERGQLADAARDLRDPKGEFKPGTAEYKKVESDLTQQEADLNAKIAIKKKEFTEREAKIYYNVYQQILSSVQKYAQQNKISLVLRFNGEPADPNQPQDILKQLNKSVVWSDESVDITAAILEIVSRSDRTGSPPKPPAR